MPTQHALITAEEGLHARPAADLAKAVAASGRAVRVARLGAEAEAVDAASMLSVMTLGLSKGDTAVLTSDDAGSEQLLTELAGLVGRPA